MSELGVKTQGALSLQLPPLVALPVMIILLWPEMELSRGARSNSSETPSSSSSVSELLPMPSSSVSVSSEASSGKASIKSFEPSPSVSRGEKDTVPTEVNV